MIVIACLTSQYEFFILLIMNVKGHGLVLLILGEPLDHHGQPGELLQLGTILPLHHTVDGPHRRRLCFLLKPKILEVCSKQFFSRGAILKIELRIVGHEHDFFGPKMALAIARAT
jgi:hypothetical protein